MRILSRLTSALRGLSPAMGGGARRILSAQRQALLPAFGVLAVAVVVAVGTLYLAERAQAGAARARAGEEAAAVATHSGWLATGDAFGGYIQLLRYADDPEVRARGTPSDVRTAVLRRQLELNTNRFDALAVVTLDGRVAAATDGAMLDALNGAAYAAVRANQGNANSDIVLPGPGIPAYVDYASILVDPGGEKWAVLIARGRPERLWQSTLATAIDGGRNVIINREGLIAAGAGAQTGEEWRGRPYAGDAILTSIEGVPSVCGLSAIAANTQIDHGWNVASCLPQATVAGGFTSGRLRLHALTLAAIAAAVAGGAVLLLPARRGAAPAAVPAPAPEPLETEAAPEQHDAAPPAAPEPVANIDARTLIEAYESRNARLALRLRESVQARLLVVSSRVDEAVETQDEDPDLARVMLTRASHDLDDLNERELRAMGQELHPDLVRLGLPAALRALKKDVSDDIEIEVDADNDADSLAEGAEESIDGGLRVALYRFVLETVRQFEEAGLGGCGVTLRRSGSDLWLAVRGHGDPAAVEEPAAATLLAIEAYGGVCRVELAADSAEAVVEFGAAAAEMPDGAEVAAEPADDPMEDGETPPGQEPEAA